MSEKHTIRNSVIATVIGGLILAAIFSPAFWHVLRELPLSIWRVLRFRIPLPIWVIGLALFIIVRLLVTWAKGSPREIHPAVTPEWFATLYAQLDTPQRQIMLLMGRADGQACTVEQFREATGTTRLKVSSALDKLHGLKLAVQTEDWMGGEIWVLSKLGRDVLIQVGEI